MSEQTEPFVQVYEPISEYRSRAGNPGEDEDGETIRYYDSPEGYDQQV